MVSLCNQFPSRKAAFKVEKGSKRQRLNPRDCAQNGLGRWLDIFGWSIMGGPISWIVDEHQVGRLDLGSHEEEGVGDFPWAQTEV